MSDVFDKYYKKYDAWYEKYPFAFLSELEAIKKVIPPNAKGLEIGVGTGRFAAALGISVGIDPSRNMLRLAKRRGVNVKLGLGEDIPFPDKSFGYVAIIIALCFAKNPVKVIEESARVLKKNGRIIIAIVDKESFLGKFYRKKKSVFYKHVKFFSVEELTDCLEQAGFALFNYYQTISVFPEKMILVEEPKKGFGRGGFVVIAAKKR